MSRSHASPIPSLSKYTKYESATSGQLSAPSFTPSLSSSGSHASPNASPSLFAESGFATSGQLSTLLFDHHPINNTQIGTRNEWRTYYLNNKQVAHLHYMVPKD